MVNRLTMIRRLYNHIAHWKQHKQDYKDYLVYCEINQLNPLSKREFIEALHEHLLTKQMLNQVIGELSNMLNLNPNEVRIESLGIEFFDKETGLTKEDSDNYI